MPEVTPESDSTGGETKKTKKIKRIFLRKKRLMLFL
jgi:hypothetical protein